MILLSNGMRICQSVGMEEVPGAARLELPGEVRLLHPEETVFEAMVSGWERQQRGGRRLQSRTVQERVLVVRRFGRVMNSYPWQWSAELVDEWMTDLLAAGKAASTIRNYQYALRSFCDYITSPHYRWAQECEERFGTHPVQVCHEWNTAAHLADYEGGPGRRPMTREELQRFFDYADDQVGQAAGRGRKGALTAYRDATLFKVVYGWGLRCRESAGLDVVDFYRNPKAPELGRFGLLQVRWGKASRGSPPRRRMVASVMPWAAEAVEDYLANIRPRFSAAQRLPALWLTERGGRIKPREIEARFAQYRQALGLPAELTLHCLRHSHVTHQIEDGTDPKFVQEQVGHRYASTTAIYTNSRELHQAGEKPQVSRSKNCRNGVLRVLMPVP
jgi:site-specific recombinase XerD